MTSKPSSEMGVTGALGGVGCGWLAGEGGEGGGGFGRTGSSKGKGAGLKGDRYMLRKGVWRDMFASWIMELM